MVHPHRGDVFKLVIVVTKFNKTFVRLANFTSHPNQQIGLRVSLISLWVYLIKFTDKKMHTTYVYKP